MGRPRPVEGVSSDGGAVPGGISQGRCPMLELHAGKLARAVLRGRGGSNASLLPDPPEARDGDGAGHTDSSSRMGAGPSGGRRGSPRRTTEPSRSTGRPSSRCCTLCNCPPGLHAMFHFPSFLPGEWPTPSRGRAVPEALLVESHLLGKHLVDGAGELGRQDTQGLGLAAFLCPRRRGMRAMLVASRTSIIGPQPIAIVPSPG